MQNIWFPKFFASYLWHKCLSCTSQSSWDSLDTSASRLRFVKNSDWKMRILSFLLTVPCYNKLVTDWSLSYSWAFVLNDVSILWWSTNKWVNMDKIRKQDIRHSLNTETLQEWVCKIKYSWPTWGFLKLKYWIIDNWGHERMKDKTEMGWKKLWKRSS
jgi:hypothetical protein